MQPLNHINEVCTYVFGNQIDNNSIYNKCHISLSQTFEIWNSCVTHWILIMVHTINCCKIRFRRFNPVVLIMARISNYSWKENLVSWYPLSKKPLKRFFFQFCPKHYHLLFDRRYSVFYHVLAFKDIHSEIETWYEHNMI